MPQYLNYEDGYNKYIIFKLHIIAENDDKAIRS